MQRKLSILAVLITALGVGLPALQGGGERSSTVVRLVNTSEQPDDAGDTEPSGAARALAWERLAQLQDPTPTCNASEQNGTGARLADTSQDGRDAAVTVQHMQEAGAGDPPSRKPSAAPVPGPMPDVDAPQQPARPLRDPTEPGEELRELVTPFRLGQPGGPAGLAVPRVRLKGRIIGPSAPPAAVLELQGALYVVHEESELTVDAPEAAAGGLTFRVDRITATEVRIQVLPLGRTIVVR